MTAYGKWNRYRFMPGTGLFEARHRVTGSKKHTELSREAARESMVLLKNEDHILPFREGQRLAVFGKAQVDYVQGGGGSGDVTCAWTKNLYEGLKELPGAVDIFEETVKFYQDYVEGEYAKGGMPGLIPEPALPSDLLEKAAASGTFIT